ncbi:hypothetical protein N5853_09285 [Bartonella sp. HY329]|uniref:hypothetical protein n=1 Tax=unclassified Bartonella TaxID=2645622 RepID=UPI0021CA994C|nr:MULTISPECIES: hypothetical protein [unclassified Bartonella]UXM94299.1 hypothetical protein N5853_09285 [Bartonella sp. HY329]UXN08622.1 hypothetical protein N5852_09295 [Bartonella sp. HY328]
MINKPSNIIASKRQLIDWGVFGLMMERRRVFVNLSQQQLAQKIGLPVPSIIAAEKGTPLCTNSFLKLCAWYGIEPKMFHAAAVQTKRAKLMQSEAV